MGGDSSVTRGQHNEKNPRHGNGGAVSGGREKARAGGPGRLSLSQLARSPRLKRGPLCDAVEAKAGQQRLTSYHSVRKAWRRESRAGDLGGLAKMPGCHSERGSSIGYRGPFGSAS